MFVVSNYNRNFAKTNKCKIMRTLKLILYSSLIFATMLCSCSGYQNRVQNATNQVNEDYYVNMKFVEKLQDSIFQIDDNIDWNKPLFSIGEMKDTVDKWTYIATDSGMCIIHKRLPILFKDILEQKFFDKQNRLLHQNVSDDNGFIMSMSYTYDGKIRTGVGKRNVGCTVEDVKEIAYFMDDSFKYDTLVQNFRVDGELTDYQKTKYEKVGDEYRIIEKRFYDNPQDTLTRRMGDKYIYKYNSQNLRVAECASNAGEYGTTTFTYKANAMDFGNTGTGATVYYDKKN